MLKLFIHAVYLAGIFLIPVALPTTVQSSEISVATTVNDPLTLPEAIRLTLEYNPRLSAAAHEIEAYDGAVVQAGVLPNPKISIGGENLGNQRLEGGDGRVSTLQIGQRIELGDKRAARVATVKERRERAVLTLAIERALVLADVGQRFVEVLTAQERLKLNNELFHLAEETTRVVAEKVKAGKVMPLEATKTEIAREAIRIRRNNTERELAAARQVLAMLWGENTPGFSVVTGDLTALPDIPDYPQLAERLVQSPVIQRWTHRVAEREAGLNLAKAKAIPDVTITAGMKRLHELDEDAYTVGVTMPLSLFDRNQGGTGEAIGRLAQARDEQRNAELEAKTALSLTWQRLTAARERVQALKTTVLPGAEQVFQAAQKGYRHGKFGLLDVLDAQRILFDAKSQYLTALTEFHRHVIELERLLGGALIPDAHL